MVDTIIQIIAILVGGGLGLYIAWRFFENQQKKIIAQAPAFEDYETLKDAERRDKVLLLPTTEKEVQHEGEIKITEPTAEPTISTGTGTTGTDTGTEGDNSVGGTAPLSESDKQPEGRSELPPSIPERAPEPQRTAQQSQHRRGRPRKVITIDD